MIRRQLLVAVWHESDLMRFSDIDHGEIRDTGNRQRVALNVEFDGDSRVAGWLAHTIVWSNAL